jgi:hypothetical protein
MLIFSDYAAISAVIGTSVGTYPQKSFKGLPFPHAFDGLCYGEPDPISNAVDYAKFFSRSHHALIRVYDGAGNVIETHERTGDFKEP